jgi:hypothetical protein
MPAWDLSENCQEVLTFQIFNVRAFTVVSSIAGTIMDEALSAVTVSSGSVVHRPMPCFRVLFTLSAAPRAMRRACSMGTASTRPSPSAEKALRRGVHRNSEPRCALCCAFTNGSKTQPIRHSRAGRPTTLINTDARTLFPMVVLAA